MNIFQIAAIMCGIALYLVMLGASLWLVIFADQDPDCRFGGVLLSLILIGFPLAVLGWG
jgi:hypothetical protein